jgi:hypothetical protein
MSKKEKETTYLFLRKYPGQSHIFSLVIQLYIVTNQRQLIFTHRRHSQTTSNPDDVEELKKNKKKEK